MTGNTGTINRSGPDTDQVHSGDWRAPMLRSAVPRVLRAMRSASAASAPRAALAAHQQPQLALAVAARRPSVRFFSSENSVTFTIVDGEGESHTVTAETGETLLDVAHDNDIELEGACGGELACSTCHLVFEKDVYDQLPEISEEEEDMLDLAWGLTDTSRLGCQICVTKNLEGMTVRIPDESNNLM